MVLLRRIADFLSGGFNGLTFKVYRFVYNLTKLVTSALLIKCNVAILPKKKTNQREKGIILDLVTRIKGNI